MIPPWKPFLFFLALARFAWGGDWLCTAYNPTSGTIIATGHCFAASVNVLGMTTGTSIAVDWVKGGMIPPTMIIDPQRAATHTYAKGGLFTPRAPAAIAIDQALLDRRSAMQLFLQWRQTLMSARLALANAPGTPALQAQVVAAAAQVISYASAASVPVTTATTQ